MDQMIESPVIPDVMEVVPALRAYARALCRNSADADDLVQDTLVKALANIHRFDPGTHLRAWLFTIMRNTFLTSIKKRNREPTGKIDCVADLTQVQATQEWSVLGGQLMAAIDRLPPQYREMVILVVMLGESYQDAAVLCNCAVGTVKSRVSRARSLLIEDLGPDAF